MFRKNDYRALNINRDPICCTKRGRKEKKKKKKKKKDRNFEADWNKLISYGDNYLLLSSLALENTLLDNPN
jgi:hypothetical protein